MKELKEEKAKGTPEFIHVFDERKREFIPAWLRLWKRQECSALIDDVVLDSSTTSYTSKAVYTAPYENGHFFFDVEWTLTPTNVQFFLEFSHDGVDWHQHSEVPWGSLLYVPAAGDKEECIDCTVRAPWMRMRAVQTGAGVGESVKVSAIVCLNG